MLHWGNCTLVLQGRTASSWMTLLTIPQMGTAFFSHTSSSQPPQWPNFPRSQERVMPGNALLMVVVATKNVCLCCFNFLICFSLLQTAYTLLPVPATFLEMQDGPGSPINWGDFTGQCHLWQLHIPMLALVLKRPSGLQSPPAICSNLQLQNPFARQHLWKSLWHLSQPTEIRVKQRDWPVQGCKSRSDLVPRSTVLCSDWYSRKNKSNDLIY